jgi:hypothetical protein
MFAHSLKERHERSLERAKSIVVPGAVDALSKLSLQHSKSLPLVDRRSSSVAGVDGAEKFKLLLPSSSGPTAAPVDVTKVSKQQ